MPFAVGDRVYKARPYSQGWYCRWGGHTQATLPIGYAGRVAIINGENCFVKWDAYAANSNVDQSELDYEDRKAGFMRKRYELLVDSPELRAGAIMEEINMGEGGFKCISKEHEKHEDVTHYARKTVMEQKEWFSEIKPLWVRIADLSIFEDMLKKYKQQNIG